MLPYCSQLPEWVRWIVQDAGGTRWAYEHEPNLSDTGWYENEVRQNIRQQIDEKNPMWREEIHNIENNKQ